MNKVLKELEDAYDGGRDSNALSHIRTLEKKRDRLLMLEEDHWKQRFRANWLRGGDQNIKFFHMKVNQRKRKNEIIGLEDSSGIWHNKLEDI